MRQTFRKPYIGAEFEMGSLNPVRDKFKKGLRCFKDFGTI